jgi:flagellar motor protein MotB
MFSAAGVAPERMAAVGYAEFQPVDDNASPEGRAANRRVVVIVTADQGLAASNEQFAASLLDAE